jgi:predicted acylesterase/phospholipase RssA
METNTSMANDTSVEADTPPRHIVISGGGPSLFTIFGAVKQMCSASLVDVSQIKSIHACSSGAFIAVCLCVVKLGMSFDELETYIVARCWKTLFASEVLDFRAMFNAKGLFENTVIKKAVAPLLVTVGLSPFTTLKELFDATGINLVMYAVDINSKPLLKVKLSHVSFPEMKVHEALGITMGLPGVMTPTFIDGMCLVDGGLMANYPYSDCLEESGDDGSGVIGFKIKWEKPRLPIDSSSNIITFLTHLMKMMAMHIDTSSRELPDGHNTVECSAPDSGNPSGWIDLFGDSAIRADYVASGVKSAVDFIAGRTRRTQQESHISH